MGWPDPHRGRAPAEEEYSRCVDPSRYRILDARIDAWVQALADLGLATAHDEPLSSLPWVGAVRPLDDVRRVLRIEPTVADGLSLLLAFTLVDGEPFGIDVGVAMSKEVSSRPAPAQVATVPQCGCGACDDGSAALLDDLDGWFVVVARGGVVHAREGELEMTATVDGAMGSGHMTWLDAAEPVAPSLRRWVGAPWA